MEKIVLTKTTKTEPIDKFIEWVDRFKGEISKDSLIIEIDTAKEMFISKTYSQDKSLVRYSQISFKEANLEIETKSFSDALKDKRVLVGIFMLLPKFINALKAVDTSSSFSIKIEAVEMDVQNEKRWCATSVSFHSPKMNMKVPGSNLNTVEMSPLPDDTFNNKVWVAPNPITIKLSGDELRNVLSISEIFASSEKLKNFMEFYTTTNEDGMKILKVRDPENESYDYELGLVEGENKNFEDFAFSIYRERFILATKNALSDTTVTISTSTPNRLLIQLGEGDTKTIIARVVR